MFKNRKFIYGLSLIFILICSLVCIFAPNDVRQVYLIYNTNMDVVNIGYTITGPGDPEAHVNVNTRNLDGNVTIINPDGDILFNRNNVGVNWVQNWTGSTGNYPIPNNVLMSGNLRDNNTDLPDILIPADQIKAPGKYIFKFTFCYYEIVPGKDDRVVDDYIDGNPKDYYILSNTTLRIDPINNITEGDNVTVTGSLVRNYDNTTLSDRLVYIDIDSNHSYNVTTDSNGRFNITVENLSIGNYMVEGIYKQDRLNPIYLTSNTGISSFSVNKFVPVPDPVDPVNPINPTNPTNPSNHIKHPHLDLNNTGLAKTGSYIPSILVVLMILVVIVVASRRGN